MNNLITTDLIKIDNIKRTYVFYFSLEDCWNIYPEKKYTSKIKYQMSEIYKIVKKWDATYIKRTFSVLNRKHLIPERLTLKVTPLKKRGTIRGKFRKHDRTILLCATIPMATLSFLKQKKFSTTDVDPYDLEDTIRFFSSLEQMSCEGMELDYYVNNLKDQMLIELRFNIMEDKIYGKTI